MSASDVSRRRVPIIPTFVVVVSAAIMVALGFWQLGRSDEKTAMIERYQQIGRHTAQQAGNGTGFMPYPANMAEREDMLYRAVAAQCDTVTGMRSTAGTNRVGAKGWAHIAQCRLSDGQEAEVALGWSRHPQPPHWSGGRVTGILAPRGKIITDPPQANLGPLAKPDPRDLPNNHLAYAGQWFFFALTALVIYALVLRRRWHARA